MILRPRTRPVVVAAVAALVFLWLLSSVWHRDTGVLFDTRAADSVTGELFDRMFGSPEHEPLLPPASELVRLGSKELVGAAAVLLALGALAVRDRWAALMALAVPVAVGVLTQYVLKPMVNNPDPQGPRAFPSGHTGGITAVSLVALVIVGRWAGPRVAAVLFPVAVLPVFVVAACLLKLQFHHATDIAGGALLATSVTLAVAAFLAPRPTPLRR